MGSIHDCVACDVFETTLNLAYDSKTGRLWMK